MGNELVEKVMEQLRSAGIRVQRGYPEGRMPHLTGPVAAVFLDYEHPDTAAVAVRIYSPAKLGGSSCENAALAAAECIAAAGGRPYLQECAFDGQLGLFSQNVQAIFSKYIHEE